MATSKKATQRQAETAEPAATEDHARRLATAELRSLSMFLDRCIAALRDALPHIPEDDDPTLQHLRSNIEHLITYASRQPAGE